MVQITEVTPGSYAALAGVKAGDLLLSVNGVAVHDVLDYRFQIYDRNLSLTLCRDNKEYAVHIRKRETEDTGLQFATPLMDRKKTCRNKCVFCFIDQMPKGMRDSLYFKDDDERLSFLQGNYITLTNLTDADVGRIIKLHLSPINISVHTTNPELRVRMMKNPRAGEVLSYIPRLVENNITVNAQIVLCKGLNDGAELDNTLSSLSALAPGVESVSVVPVGLTDHREGLYPLEPFGVQDAAAVITTVERHAEKMLGKYGTRIFYPSDEFFLTAGRELPDCDYYDGFPQLENGVGMLTLFGSEADEEIENIRKAGLPDTQRHISVCTGKLAYPAIKSTVEKITGMCYNIQCDVYRIENNVFGKNITVSGLLTGRDIAAQLSGKELGEALYIPENCLRHPDNDFLCGMTPQQLSALLRVPVRSSGRSGADFVRSIIGKAE